MTNTENQPVRYVTFGPDGVLDGCYLQVLPEEHAIRAILIDEESAAAWVNYRANEARDGIELLPPAPPAPPAVPESISPRQFRQSLNHFGYRQRVDSAIAASTDQDLKDWYEFTSDFQRHHPEVLTMASALGFTSAQLDEVWTYGFSL
jgi:hypothetical protein